MRRSESRPFLENLCGSNGGNEPQEYFIAKIDIWHRVVNLRAQGDLAELI